MDNKLRLALPIFLAFLIFQTCKQSEPKGKHVGMKSSKPAARWEDALISGNGVMGILVFGDIENEKMIFNHEFCYEPIGTENIEPPKIAKYMPEVKRLMLAGNYREAHDYSVKMGQQEGFQNILWTDPYHPALQMKISQSAVGEKLDYFRGVDFETGEVHVSWTDDYGSHSRKSFVSRPDNVIVQKLTSDSLINCLIEISDLIDTTKLRRNQIPDDLHIETPRVDVTDNWITFRQGYSLVNRGYESGTLLVLKGGTSEVQGTQIKIMDAKEVLLLTRINYLEDFSNSKLESTKAELEAFDFDYESLLNRHAAIHGEIFKRVKFELSSGKVKTSEEFIAQQKENADTLDPAFLQAMFNMGRYTLISSSGKNPPNLMGIWNGDWRPAWSGDFTLDANINLQIAAANLGNTREAIDSYMNLLERIVPDWETNAKNIYGVNGYFGGIRTSGRRGLHTHFGKNFPGHFWVSASEWLLLPCYEYYQVSGDMDFLQNRLLPMMKKTVLFYEEFLTEQGENGNYIFVPSYSPENKPANSRGTGATINATMDIAAAKEAITNLITVCKELKIEDDHIPRWEAMLNNMPPYLINEGGALKEWASYKLEDFNAHRHVSHLYPAWPGLEINPEETPELFEAAKKAALDRGRGNGSAHGLAHMALIGSRLKMDDLVYGNLLFMLKNDYIYRSLFTSHNPGIIYNSDMLNSLPAVVMEMLVYSRPGVIELLPACSSRLKSGKIGGVKCRTQATVENLEWNFEERKILAVISSNKDQSVELMYRKGIQSYKCSKSSARKSENTLIIDFKKGESAEIEIHME